MSVLRNVVIDFLSRGRKQEAFAVFEVAVRMLSGPTSPRRRFHSIHRPDSLFPLIAAIGLLGGTIANRMGQFFAALAGHTRKRR